MRRANYKLLAFKLFIVRALYEIEKYCFDKLFAADEDDTVIVKQWITCGFLPAATGFALWLLLYHVYVVDQQ